MAALQTEYSKITHARCPPDIFLKNSYSLVICLTSSSAPTLLALNIPRQLLLEFKELGDIEAET
jgi:hypothetical protein